MRTGEFETKFEAMGKAGDVMNRWYAGDRPVYCVPAHERRPVRVQRSEVRARENEVRVEEPHVIESGFWTWHVRRR